MPSSSQLDTDAIQNSRSSSDILAALKVRTYLDNVHSRQALLLGYGDADAGVADSAEERDPGVLFI